MTAERFDALLAEMREFADGIDGDAVTGTTIQFAHRLADAHKAEVAEVRESARHEAVAMGLLADRAVGLLRDIVWDLDQWAGVLPEVRAQLDAFLSEQKDR